LPATGENLLSTLKCPLARETCCPNASQEPVLWTADRYRGDGGGGCVCVCTDAATCVTCVGMLSWSCHKTLPSLPWSAHDCREPWQGPRGIKGGGRSGDTQLLARTGLHSRPVPERACLSEGDRGELTNTVCAALDGTRHAGCRVRLPGIDGKCSPVNHISLFFIQVSHVGSYFLRFSSGVSWIVPQCVLAIKVCSCTYPALHYPTETTPALVGQGGATASGPVQGKLHPGARSEDDDAHADDLMMIAIPIAIKL